MRTVVALAVILLATGSSAAEPTVYQLFGGSDPIVAEIDGRPVRLSDVDGTIRSDLNRTLFDLDRKLAGAVDAHLLEQLLDSQAATAGLSAEAWLAQEVDRRMRPVTPAEIREAYQSSAHAPQTPLSEVHSQLVAQLQARKRAETSQLIIDELKRQHGVAVHLTPMRVEVSADDDPGQGPLGAPVTIVEFSDFQCGYCARAHDTLTEVVAGFPNEVRWVARDFPLVSHAKATMMAEAAQCAAEQQRYWPYADGLFAMERTVVEEDLYTLALQLGLNAPNLRRCLESGRYSAEVQHDIEDGKAAGVTGTPAFFINGRMISGAQPAEVFIELIQDELGRR